MATASVRKPNGVKQKTIPSGTLLEELYTHYSLSQLQAMLKTEPEQLLLQTWNVTPEKWFADLRVAIEYVKND